MPGYLGIWANLITIQPRTPRSALFTDFAPDDMNNNDDMLTEKCVVFPLRVGRLTPSAEKFLFHCETKPAIVGHFSAAIDEDVDVVRIV